MVTVSLEEYDIHVGDIWGKLRAFLDQSNYGKILVIVDENTKRDCLPTLLREINNDSLLIIETRSGEINKNLETCKAIWTSMMELRAGRKDLTINLGGGVIGDMGGFCASTFKRGMDFIQMPTTLLSQVDSSIGGKLGIDFGPIKNSIGLFKNPKMVLIDPGFLKTLPKRELRSGLAEMIKHSLIADADQWKQISSIDKLDDFDWIELLVPSLKIKKRIVEADPFENNIRKSLNFGHTIGHAIEGYALNTATPLLHGEAIAIGMICEAWLSQNVLGMQSQALDQIQHFIKRQYGKYDFSEIAFPELLAIMRQDKKNEDHRINFTMLKQPGEALINQYCTDELIMQSMMYYRKLS